MNKKSFAYPIVFMAVITAVFVLILAFLNETTADIIAFNEQVDLQMKILYVFDIDYDEENPEEVEEIFNKYVETKENSDGQLIYTAEDENGQVIGHAFPATGAGLWGTIKAYVGISDDNTRMLGIEFIEQEETPGLGGRIDEEVFKEQFRDIDLQDAIDNKFIIYNPAPGGNVDAIAGATQTSQAVADIINKDMTIYIEGGMD